MNRYAVWLAALGSLFMALLVTREFAAQDILHVSVHSTVTEFYRTYVDTGTGFPATESSAFLFFPSDLVDGSPRVNFPLPATTRKLRIAFGETAANTVSGIHICLERFLFVSRCLEGGDVTPVIESVSGAKLANVNGLTQISVVEGRPIVTFSENIFRLLRPERDFWAALALFIIFLGVAMLFFCFLIALLMPVFAWLTWDALWLFLATVSVRVLAFSIFGQRLVSDSDLFIRYLQVHVFSLPGIRGIVYPIFVSMFHGNPESTIKAQLFLGAIGSILVLLLIRSFKAKSPWDLLFAFAATSVPSLIAMEDLVLSESLSLFLILSILLIFRWVQGHARSMLSIAGLGAASALLTQTKPQFSFVWVLFALSILWSSGFKQALHRFLIFATPTVALYLFAVALDYSAGNFRGASSTLGYSLFDHGQLSISCPTNLPDPHAKILCKARASLGPDGDPTTYTAWAIYPSMRNLGEPFYRVTESFTKLSVRLISTHPGLYLQTVTKSFLRFWTGDIPMTHTFLMSSASPGVQRIMPAIISADRIYRDLVVAAFFLLLATAFILQLRSAPTEILFLSIASLIAIISSILQALVEYGLESARFEIPTEPLLTVVVVYLAIHCYNRIVRPSRADR